MRNEEAKIDIYPVGIRFLSIKNYPVSWKDALQLIWVVKGEIDITVENEKYTLYEDQVDIINVDEVYSIESDKENKILILDVDPNFFERYYEDAGEVFYYTDEADQHEEKYDIFRKFMAKIAYEVYKKLEDYEEVVEQETLSLMYHLLNKFHYLYYEGDTETWDYENFQRSHRIVKYIYNHYQEKASLKDLADQEYLSSPYLSSKIKETFGETFNEYLNRIRAEESTKLLLDTSLSITDISEEVGFSHVRYYNKYFENNYGMTPSKYRKKYRMPKKTYEQSHLYKELPLSELFEEIHLILINYPRYEYDNQIVRLDIDLESGVEKYYKSPEIIDIGNASLLLEEEYQRLFRELQSELNFKRVILEDLFIEDMDIYRGKSKFINWTRIESLLEFLDEMEVEPLIFAKENDREIIEEFIIYFEDNFPNIREKIIYDIFTDNLPKNHKIYDRIEMSLFLIEAFLDRKDAVIPVFVDEITRDTVLNNETFFGGKGLFTNNFLKKPSYYAFMFLSLLGEEIIYQDEGIFITKSEKGYEMLLFHPYIKEEKDFFTSLDKVFPEKRLSLNLRNMKSDFIITKYVLNREEGSAYDKWEGLGKPERLEEDEWELFKDYVHPSVDFFSVKKMPIYNLFEKLPPMSIALYLMRKMDEQ